VVRLGGTYAGELSPAPLGTIAGNPAIQWVLGGGFQPRSTISHSGGVEMQFRYLKLDCVFRSAAVCGLTLLLGMPVMAPAVAQTETTANVDPQDAVDSDAAAPLSEDELEILVARIALYPDDLVALVSTASVYPLQIVEAARYLDRVAKDKSLKPKDSWDGSVISLLNYPDVLKMMSDDLEWTQSLGNALANQQADVLNAIQQLRDEAVAKGIIKTDEKIKVVQQDNDVIIQPVNSEEIYVPRYEPEMLYTSDYAPAPVSYYPDPYPNYYYPTAPYFPGFVTGALWGATVSWAAGGVWGGRWNDNDLNIDCNKCFNNINGKVRMNDVDWRNVDRSKINFDRKQFDNMDRSKFQNSLRSNNNSFDRRVTDARKSGNIGNRSNVSNKRVSANDVRAAKNSNNRNSNNKVKVNNNVKVDKSGNKNRTNVNANRSKTNNARTNNAKSKSNINRTNKKANVKNKSNVNRNANRSKPGARVDNRGRRPSALGDVRSGRNAQMHSNRGRASMSHNRGGMRMNRGGRRR
jgi:hypothetical protein